MKKHFHLVSALALSSLLLASCGEDNTKTQGNTPNISALTIEGFVVEKTQINDFMDASGTVVAGEEVEIAPEISAKIIGLPSREGQFVNKGDLLVKLFDSDLQSQKRKISAQLDLARVTVKRLQPLKDKEGISRQEFDQAQLQVELLEAELNIIDVNISKTELRAPFSGVLGLKQVSEGAYINAGTTVYTLRSYQPLKLDFTVPEKYASAISKDLNVKFRVQNHDSSFDAKISAIESGIEMDTRNLKARAMITSKHNAIIPGAFAEVEVPTAVNKEVILIPTEAIIPSDRKKMVVVSRNGIAEFVPVETGIRQQSLVEISKGLTVGDTIAITGILFLKPGTPIQFSSIKE